MSRGRLVIFAVTAGLALGVATRFVYQLPHEWWWLARIGGPWLVVAFAVGCATRRVRWAALAGGICLVSATLVYYAILAFVQHGYHLSPIGLGWLVVAVPAGLAFGALGSVAWRSPLRGLAVAGLAVCSAAETALRFQGVGELALFKAVFRVAGVA